MPLWRAGRHAVRLQRNSEPFCQKGGGIGEGGGGVVRGAIGDGVRGVVRVCGGREEGVG